MRQQQDGIGGGRWVGLVAVSTAILLAGCGWFDGGSASDANARPGADRQIAPSNSLPPASGGGQHEPGIAPVADNTPAIGSIVADKGGQKVQKEAFEKEQIERDIKEREERDAARRAAEEKVPGAPDAPPAGVPPTSAAPAPAPVQTAPAPPLPDRPPS
jgi:hypothetical protein